MRTGTGAWRPQSRRCGANRPAGHPRVIAEYDDAALMKVAAADGLGCFPLPTVAVKEALMRYGFQIVGQAGECSVQFYAISAERKLTHPAVMAITSHTRGPLFG